MHGIVKKNIGMDIFLPGAHINMVGRDLGKFLHDPLGTDPHKLGRYSGTNKHLCHLAQLPHKLLCTGVHRLGAVKFRVAEIGVDAVDPGAYLAPALFFVDGHRGIKFMFFIGQPDGIAGAFH